MTILKDPARFTQGSPALRTRVFWRSPHLFFDLLAAKVFTPDKIDKSPETREEPSALQEGNGTEWSCNFPLVLVLLVNQGVR